MCGIAGLVRRDGPLDGPAAAAATLGSALSHRGPDGSGVWRSPSVPACFVHRRLAIIDLSNLAAQPMASPDSRRVITFNGEIYNYRELRQDLEGRGERFRTSSDTEVLLRLIQCDGTAALSRVRGMFAFGYWDEDARSLLLARDRFGIKPLYIVRSSSTVAFASELNALRAAGLAESQPSAASVLAFLAWGSIPAPLAWLRGAEMLEPGTWYEWRHEGSERRGRFADAREQFAIGNAATDESADALTKHVTGALGDSVRAHLVADVPVGVFLSGGIDSSALVSAAINAGATKLQTFTVTFADPLSEATHARAVAAAFGTEHHELTIDASDLVDDVPRILGQLDQPSNDAINSYYVSRAVAERGIKAVLSGTGGDELFGGYPSFHRIPTALKLKRVAGPLFHAAAPLVSPALPLRLRPRWKHFAATNGSARDAYQTQRGFFMPAEISTLAGPALADEQVWREATGRLDEIDDRRFQPAATESPTAAVARMETTHYLASQLLRDIDVMSMAHGLEVRVPFVDHELAAAVWPALGRHEDLQRGKRLLVTSLDRPLPHAIAARPKQGFVLPFAQWMRGELRPFVHTGMRQLASAGWVDARVPDAVWAAWMQGRMHWSRPWGLAVLGTMMRP